MNNFASAEAIWGNQLVRCHQPLVPSGDQNALGHELQTSRIDLKWPDVRIIDTQQPQHSKVCNMSMAWGCPLRILLSRRCEDRLICSALHSVQ